METREASDALQNLDGAVTLPDGFRLHIRTESCAPPISTLTEEVQEKIKVVMSSRFTAATKALDLKRFHADRQFLGEPVYAPLNRSNVVNTIVKIIGENIPNIEAVDFTDNKMRNLDHFETLTEKAPNVKVLYLADNTVILKKEKLTQFNPMHCSSFHHLFSSPFPRFWTYPS